MYQSLPDLLHILSRASRWAQVMLIPHDSREIMKRPLIVIAATALATMTAAGVAGGSAAQADATHPAKAAVTLPASAVPFATANRAMGAVAA